MQGIKEDVFSICMQMHVLTQMQIVNHIVLIIRQLFPYTHTPISNRFLLFSNAKETAL